MKKEEKEKGSNFDFDKRTQFEFDFEKDKDFTPTQKSTVRRVAFSLFVVTAIILASSVFFLIPNHNGIRENRSCETRSSSNKEPLNRKPSSINDAAFSANSRQDSIVYHVEQTAENTSLAVSEQSYDIESLVVSVIQGKYGNGQERREKLGSKYAEVQHRINEIYKKNRD